MNDTFADAILAACAELGGEPAGIFTYKMSRTSKGHPTISENIKYLEALTPIVEKAYKSTAEMKTASLSATNSGYGLTVEYTSEIWTKES